MILDHWNGHELDFHLAANDGGFLSIKMRRLNCATYYTTHKYLLYSAEDVKCLST